MASLRRRQQRWSNRYRLPTACNVRQWDVVSDLIGAGKETMHTRLSRYISLFTQQLTSIARRRYDLRAVNALSDEWGTNLTPGSRSASRQQANSPRTYSFSRPMPWKLIAPAGLLQVRKTFAFHEESGARGWKVRNSSNARLTEWFMQCGLSSDLIYLFNRWQTEWIKRKINI